MYHAICIYREPAFHQIKIILVKTQVQLNANLRRACPCCTGATDAGRGTPMYALVSRTAQERTRKEFSPGTGSFVSDTNLFFATALPDFYYFSAAQPFAYYNDRVFPFFLFSYSNKNKKEMNVFFVNYILTAND